MSQRHIEPPCASWSKLCLMAQSVNGLAAVCMTFLTYQIHPKIWLSWLVSQMGLVLLKRLGPQRVAERVRWPGIKIWIFETMSWSLEALIDIKDIRISKNSETKSINGMIDHEYSPEKIGKYFKKNKNWWWRTSHLAARGTSGFTAGDMTVHRFYIGEQGRSPRGCVGPKPKRSSKL